MAQTDDLLNCEDLSEAEEQQVFDQDPSDPNNLDGNDNDGKPCESDTTDNGSYPATNDNSTSNDNNASNDQYDNPKPGPQDVVEGSFPNRKLAPTGGIPLALPLALLMVAGGLVGLGIVRRR